MEGPVSWIIEFALLFVWLMISFAPGTSGLITRGPSLVSPGTLFFYACWVVQSPRSCTWSPPPGLCYVAASGCYSLTGEVLMCPLETRPGTFSFGSLFCLLVFFGVRRTGKPDLQGVFHVPQNLKTLFLRGSQGLLSDTYCCIWGIAAKFSPVPVRRLKTQGILY